REPERPPWSLDQLDPADIPKSERFPWQPKELVAVLGEHRRRHWSSVMAVAFSPDGKLLASGGYDNVIRLWDVAGDRERLVLKGPGNPVLSVAFTRDGRTLASAADSAEVKLWDVGTGKERARLRHEEGVMSLAFSADDKTLITGSRDMKVRLWDVGKKEVKWTRKMRTGAKGDSHWVVSVAFAPDGKTVAAGTQEKS